jgi:hypothetical protein
MVLVPPPALQVDYLSGQGLVVKVSGMTVIDGSGFQYYEPGWSKGYYSSHWDSQLVKTQPDGSILATFNSKEGAEGQVVVTTKLQDIHLEYTFRWHGDHAVMIENGIGVVRKPFFISGESEDGRSLPLAAAQGQDIWSSIQSTVLTGPLFDLKASCGRPMDALDGDKVDEDWNLGGGTIWFGNAGLPIKPGEEVHVAADWEIPALPKITPADSSLDPDWNESRIAKGQDSPLPLDQHPAIAWRGIHLFVGPHALEFHKRLIERVLKPLGFNYAVLQCERTAWDCTPGVQTSITMTKPDLAKLFALYRKNGIEPIPMIESFGHMPWLFEHGKNLDLAYNPQIPYEIDPGKPAARELVAKIWEEAIALLHPRAIHFGMDEVDLRGFEPNDADKVTRLWNIQVPFLLAIADKHHVKAMLWGDKMLAPGEAPDACLGDSATSAAARRAVVTPGTVITDWHYAPNPDPSVYTSLKLWTGLGMPPIAADWFRLENIAGFTKAAQNASAGTLLTTWAGYESSEEAMLADTKQFSAFVFAGLANSDPDAALSTLKSEGVPKTSNRMRTLFQHLYFGPAEAGGAGQNAELADLVLQGIQGPDRPASILVNTKTKGKMALLIGLSCEATPLDSETVGNLDLTFEDGSTASHAIVYGLDVTNPGGEATFRSDGGVIRIDLGGKRLKSLRVAEVCPFGLSIRSLRVE